MKRAKAKKKMKQEMTVPNLSVISGGAADQASEESLLMGALPAVVFATDLNGTIRFWNKHAARLFGWSVEEAIGKNAFDIVFRSGGIKLSELLRALSESDTREFEFREALRDGSQALLGSRISLVKNSAGEPARILVLCRDITEKKDVEARRLRAERLQSIGTLAGGIAHDVNNALLPIMFAAEMLKSNPPNEKRMEFADQVMRNAERVQNIMRQILLFVGSIRPGAHRVDIRRLLTDTEQMLKHTLPKTIQVRTQFASSLHSVSGEETQIAQALMNLSLNARDAMRENGTLTLTAENVQVDSIQAAQHPHAKPGPHVLITVMDTGSGIPNEILDKIFDPFFTTKSVGKGTGLGLSTVLGIVRTHGGFLSVSTRENAGTKFQIWLPAVEGASTSTAQSEAKPAPTQFPIPQGKGQTILVIDDEESVRKIAKEALESCGYQVLTASDGTEAIALYAQQKDKIAAILCDMMMPVMDGAMTIKALKRIEPSVPILAMSGLIEDRATSAKAAGAGVLLQKPFSAETLLKTVALFVR